MDAVFEFLYALMHWRLLLSVALSIVLALFLSNTFDGFTAGYCISLVILAIAFGIIWQARGEAGVGLLDTTPPTPISKPVAFLSFMLIGFFWGGLASWFFNSQIFGALALVLAVAIIGIWYRFVLHHRVSLSYLMFASASLLSGFALIPILQLLYA